MDPKDYITEHLRALAAQILDGSIEIETFREDWFSDHRPEARGTPEDPIVVLTGRRCFSLTYTLKSLVRKANNQG